MGSSIPLPHRAAGCHQRSCPVPGGLRVPPPALQEKHTASTQELPGTAAGTGLVAPASTKNKPPLPGKKGQGKKSHHKPWLPLWYL